MITFATFGRRLGAFVLAWLVDLLVLGLLAAIGVGEHLLSLWAAWYFIHHVGMVAEGGTFGHRLLGLRVVRADGEQLSLLMATVRWLVECASALSLGFGYLWMLDEPQRRTWHDLAAGSVVVRESGRAAVAAPDWADDPPWQRAKPEPAPVFATSPTPPVPSAPTPTSPKSPDTQPE